MIMDFVEMSNPFENVPAVAGQMIYELIKRDVNNTPEFAFLIKEETKYINKHKYKPIMQLRTGLMKIDNVWFIPMMLLVDNDFDMLYEGCFNYHQTNGGKQYLQALGQQDTIVTLFYNEKNVNARTIEMHNTLKDDFTEIAFRLSNVKAWSMEDFDRAKEKIFKLFPSPLILWEKLIPIEGIKIIE